jgi:DNA-binding NarL/FixJ family response regulator
MLVGREKELAAIQHALHGLGGATQLQRSRFLEVVGDPGIGKTSLLDVLRAEAEARGWWTLRGCATEFETEVPLYALVDAMDDTLSGIRPSLSASLVSALGTVFPALFDSNAAAETTMRERYRLHRSIGQLLEHIAAAGPVVVILDDMQWADPALVDLLAHLTRHPPRARVLIALAYRPRQVPARLVDALATAPDGLVDRRELGPLTAEQTGELLGAAVAPSRARELHDHSGGNPFYLQALARAAMDASVLTARTNLEPLGGDMPAAVRAALLTEMDGLSATARLVADIAAVAGDPFEPDLVADVAELDATRVQAAIDELVERDLIRPESLDARFGYRHPLVRHVAYNATGPAWRCGAHGRVARALERRGAPLVIRAHHVARSARPGDTSAVELLAAAARDTLARAPGSSVEMLRAALALMPEPAATGTAAAASRHALEAELAQALSFAGDLWAARALVDRLLGELRPTSPARPGVAGVRAMIERLLGRHAEARAGLLAELAVVPEDRRADVAALQLELAAAGPLAGQFTECDAVAAERALEAARQAEDRPLEAAAGCVLAFARYTAGAIEPAVVQLDQATLLVDGLTDRELARRLDAAVWLGWSEVFLERYEHAVAHFERGLLVGRLAGQGHLLTYLLVGLSAALGFLGRLVPATRCAEDAVEAAEFSGSDELRTMAYSIRCLNATRVGDRRGALLAGEQAVAAAGAVRDWWSVVAELALAQARLTNGFDPADCRESILRVAGGPELSSLDAGARPTFCQLLVHTELARGDTAAAAEWVDRIEVLARALGPRLRGPCAYAHLTRAEVLLAVGDAEAAAAAARVALSGFEAISARVDASRARLLVGLACAAAGRRAPALAELAKAQVEFADAGARRMLDEAVRAQRRLGRRVAGRTAGQPCLPGAKSHPRLAGLTRREAEVAALIGEGRTNRQIAAQLVVSERTVDAHLRNMFAKLDVSSRAAVAAALASDGSIPEEGRVGIRAPWQALTQESQDENIVSR